MLLNIIMDEQKIIDKLLGESILDTISIKIHESRTRGIEPRLILATLEQYNAITNQLIVEKRLSYPRSTSQVSTIYSLPIIVKGSRRFSTANIDPSCIIEL